MKREPEKVTREKHGKMTEEKSNTTFSEGADPELRRCDSDTYQCLICTKRGAMQSLCLICRDTKGQWWSTVERAQQAQQKRREACCLLTSVITEDQGMLQHLKATVHALGAVHSISLDKAKEMYMRGTEFDSSEITQLGEQLQSHISSKARQKLDSFLSNYKKALECEEFLGRL